jgi:hypothetical protein
MTFEFPEYGGRLTMHVNNAGFYEDLDTKLVKPQGVYRMMFVGDSQTAGECANSESYPHVASAIITRTLGNETVEGLNAGAGRYSPYQYFVKTQSQLLAFGPDHLIVGIYMGNDMMDLLRRDDRPYLVKSADGTLRHHSPDFILLDDPETPPSDLSDIRLYGLFWRAIGSGARYQVTRAKILMHDTSNNGRGMGDVLRYMMDVKRLSDISIGFMTQALLQFVWFQHFPESLPLALEMNQHVLNRFKRMAESNKVKLTYVLIPSKVVVEPADFPDVLQKVQHYNGRYTLERIQAFENHLTDLVAQQCQESGIRVIDLREPLLAAHPGRRLYNPLEMHLTVAGNKVVGKVIAEALGQEVRSTAQPR